ncbi:uncharacterized protein LOC141495123 [Macrotis lagotis]|uniref:uncharacterized protein LOC141495123 n=1 Tax=Macrotis lagotis TaxID=92651 RepID=UPI003D699822
MHLATSSGSGPPGGAKERDLPFLYPVYNLFIVAVLSGLPLPPSPHRVLPVLFASQLDELHPWPLSFTPGQPHAFLADSRPAEPGYGARLTGAGLRDRATGAGLRGPGYGGPGYGGRVTGAGLRDRATGPGYGGPTTGAGLRGPGYGIGLRGRATGAGLRGPRYGARLRGRGRAGRAGGYGLPAGTRRRARGQCRRRGRNRGRGVGVGVGVRPGLEGGMGVEAPGEPGEPVRGPRRPRPLPVPPTPRAAAGAWYLLRERAGPAAGDRDREGAGVARRDASVPSLATPTPAAAAATATKRLPLLRLPRQDALWRQEAASRQPRRRLIGWRVDDGHRGNSRTLGRRRRRHVAGSGPTEEGARSPGRQRSPALSLPSPSPPACHRGRHRRPALGPGEVPQPPRTWRKAAAARGPGAGGGEGGKPGAPRGLGPPVVTAAVHSSLGAPSGSPRPGRRLVEPTLSTGAAGPRAWHRDRKARAVPQRDARACGVHAGSRDAKRPGRWRAWSTAGAVSCDEREE